MKAAIFAALAVLLAGCGVSAGDAANEELPASSKRLSGGGGHVSYVVPLQMDGAKCFAIVGNSAGRSISCVKD